MSLLPCFNDERLKKHSQEILNIYRETKPTNIIELYHHIFAANISFFKYITGFDDFSIECKIHSNNKFYNCGQITELIINGNKQIRFCL